MRVGIIGLGFGAAVHLPALRMLPDVQVVALGGQRAEKARELASRFGIEIAGNAQDVLNASLNAVTVALPPELGATIVAQALGMGIAVLAEKPLAESAERAIALAREARGHTAVMDFELAELDCLHMLKQQIEGRSIESVKVSWRTSSYAHSHRKWSWKTDRARHGGVMNLLGSHIFFLAEWLFGPIETISARFSSERTRGFAPAGAEPAEDRALLKVITQGGLPIEVELDNAAGGTGQVWEIDLPGGRLILAESGASEALELFLEKPGSRTLLASDVAAAGVDWRIEPFRRLAARFIDCAVRRVECAPGFDVGARVQLLLEKSRDSAAHDGVELIVE